MRPKPLTLVPLLSFVTLATASLAAQQASEYPSRPATLAPAGPRIPQAKAAHKAAKVKADEKLSIFLMDNAYIAANQQPCYTVRSYSYSPTDPDTGRVRLTGTSTCQPGRNFHRRDAVASLQQQPTQH